MWVWGQDGAEGGGMDGRRGAVRAGAERGGAKPGSRKERPCGLVPQVVGV